MLKIGITGGIGSGKSTVCEVWKSLGATLINADAVAKKIMVNDASVKRQLIETFGKETYHPDGLLNRPFLAAEAFEKNRVEALNSIVHPAVFKETERLMEKAEQNGYKATVYEAAILFQHGRPDMFDYIILVLADEKLRINRAQKRDAANENNIKNRIKTQQNFEKFENKADIVIRNNGTLKAFKKKAEEVYQQLLERSK